MAEANEPKTVPDVPELVALRLVTVYCDGSTTLVSLTHDAILADFEDERVQHGIPHVYLGHDDEQDAEREFYGKVTDGGFPGWPAIFAWLKAHPERLDHGKDG